jgi:ubiquinone/menaquinone biosynthesis C-methylase UbiE
MNSNYKHSDHFSALASQYHLLRTIDVELVTYIARQLKSVPAIKAADIGCGNGLYTALMLEHLRAKAPLIHCIDYNAEMLKQVRLYFAGQDDQPASTVNASAMKLPLKSEAFNCLFAFNAIHHFVLAEFFGETTRILQDSGHLFIYTRLRSQNSSNIWGRYFPAFTSKNTGLYELDELEESISKTPGLKLKKTKIFRFKRKSDLATLVYRAQNRHYCTFNLYKPDELGTALDQFSKNVMEHFENPEDIQWVDEYSLLILQKTSR